MKLTPMVKVTNNSPDKGTPVQGKYIATTTRNITSFKERSAK
jgi:hypothetical protein